MKTDAQLKADVLAELAWDPAVNPAAIGVIVKNGLVTLTGHLDTLAQKHAAERAAWPACAASTRPSARRSVPAASRASSTNWKSPASISTRK